MKITWSLFGGTLLLLLVAAAVVEVPSAAFAQKVRNPFGLPDVPNPQGKDVKEYAATVKLPGGPKDANAEQWTKMPLAGEKGSIDGEWYSRWKEAGKDWVFHKAKSQIKTIDDRVYILFKEPAGTFLIETIKQGNKLVGRYYCVNDAKNTGPCVFLVVNDERIDGVWAGQGRWDFRRNLK